MSSYALSNCTLWPGDGSERVGHVVIDGDRIKSVGDGPYRGELPVEDLQGTFLSPGLIDIMLCGGFGTSFFLGDPDRMLSEYIKLGVTSCQMCAGCQPWDTLEKIADVVRSSRARARDDSATLLGAYWEGPFQHPDLTGASLREYSLPPTRENVEKLLAIARDVTYMVNVSPGTECDQEGIRTLREAGITVAMAHADSHAEAIEDCLEAGTSVLGHVWNNNMGKLAEPGVQCPTIDHVGLTDDRVRFVHLICDGTHVHPVIMRLVQRCKGTERICVVTDALTGAGEPDGEYEWTDGRIFTKANQVHRTAEGNLAGSGLLLPDHLRNFSRFTGVPLHKAIRTVTLNPASCLGIDGEIGLLAEGRKADLSLWNDRFELQGVWKNGTRLATISRVAEIRL